MDKFYAVWKQNGGGAPNKKHDSKDGAIQEASRLAQQSQESYLILEVIGIVKPMITPVDYTEIKG